MSSQPYMKDDDGRSFVVKDGVWYHYGPAWWAMYGHAVLTGDVVGKAELAELEVLDLALIYEGKSTDERKAITVQAIRRDLQHEGGVGSEGRSPSRATRPLLYMQRLSLHHFYRASIRKACVHMLSTGCGEKNDAKLTAVCIRRVASRVMAERRGAGCA